MVETSAAKPTFHASRGMAVQALARGHFFIWLPVFFACGVGCYFALRVEPDWRIYPTLMAAGLALPLALRHMGAALPVAWTLCFVALGFSVAGFQAHRVAAPILEYRYYGPIEGRVVGIDRSASGKLRLTLDQVRLDRVAPAKRPERVRVSLHGEQPYLDPKPGQIVMMTGHLSPPSGPVEPGGFDFQRHAFFAQLGGVGYTRTPALLQSPADNRAARLRIFQIRMTLSAAITSRLPGREGAFATAILTGDRSSIDQTALDALRASNLAHLLAISGLHMGLLTGVVFAMVRLGFALHQPSAMRANPKKIAAVVAFFAGVTYLALSGANVATQRAFVMVAVMLLAVCLDRRALTLRAVAVAALIVLVISPDSLAGPGFQMSFAATTALVAVFAEIRDRQLMIGWPKWARNVASLVISSAIAGVATAPFGALHFNQMAQWGLVANLASVPVMGLVVMPGAVLAAVLTPFGLEQLGLEIMRLGLRWILFVAETVASWDTALRLIPSPDPIVLPLLGLGGALLCLLQSRLRLSGALVLVLAGWLWSMTERPDLLVSDTGTLIGLNSPQGRVLNKPKGDGFVAGAWLENDGDSADQERASARGDFTRNEARIRLGAHMVHFLTEKEITPTDLSQFCAKADLLILPNIAEQPDCAAITRSTLRQSGSLAISDTETGLGIVTSNDVRGARLWVR
ncbi:ComEC/Rec2 family competence protein [uncultured Litoreibacter sp.]|uniref:ComEC/Rec2 family competence protein n=1 Tax=uncultured Litoreibacter sp. TaxID=1392394 RepID=UPI002621BDCE|nr:ComEC/Rec2 family competence protein [uncultured Litoreibacter sp.]